MMSLQMIETLGWTLIHTLWQGAGIAFIVCLGLVLCRNHRPAVRHAILMAGLIAIPALALFTFSLLQQPPSEMVFTTEPVASAAHAVTADAEATIVTSWQAQLESAFPFLVMLWMTGVLMLALRTLGGYLLTRRLALQHARKGDPLWQEMTDDLCQRMGLLRQVTLLVSDRVSVPVVVGHLKPVILMPLSVLSGLSYKEVEAVLLHELGHVKRNDYLINMLQTVLEVVFFYHPAVWWLSGRLRSEREMCCDDMAIAISGDPLTFARALAHLQEVNMQVPHGAMAATGRGALFSRIKRIMGPHETRTGPVQAVMTASLVVFGIFALARCSGVVHANTQSPIVINAQDDYSFLDPIIPGDGSGVVRINHNDQTMAFHFENHELSRFLLDGKPQELSWVVKHRPKIEAFLAEVAEAEAEAREMERQARREEEQAREMERQARLAEEQAIRVEQQARLQEKLAQEMERRAIRDQEHARELAEKAQVDAERVREMAQQVKELSERAQELTAQTLEREAIVNQEIEERMQLKARELELLAKKNQAMAKTHSLQEMEDLKIAQLDEMRRRKLEMEAMALKESLQKLKEKKATLSKARSVDKAELDQLRAEIAQAKTKSAKLRTEMGKARRDEKRAKHEEERRKAQELRKQQQELRRENQRLREENRKLKEAKRKKSAKPAKPVRSEKSSAKPAPKVKPTPSRLATAPSLAEPVAVPASAAMPAPRLAMTEPAKVPSVEPVLETPIAVVAPSPVSLGTTEAVPSPVAEPTPVFAVPGVPEPEVAPAMAPSAVPVVAPVPTPAPKSNH